VGTQQIFEQPKERSGDAAARSRARTFASVSQELRDVVARAEFRILRDSIDDHGARRGGLR
jgi:hypothetical protein